MVLKLAIALLLLGHVIAESGAITVNDLGLQWSHQGRIKCKKCVPIFHLGEAAEGWDNNFLCTKRDHGIQWSNNGTIEGMKCEKADEEMDGASEHNNYLCVSNSSTWEFRFLANSTIGDMSCILMNEPDDQQSWHNNYLCVITTPTTASTTTPTTTTTSDPCPLMAGTQVIGTPIGNDSASTPADCALACIREPACRAMSFNDSGPFCTLFSDATQIPADDITTCVKGSDMTTATTKSSVTNAITTPASGGIFKCPAEGLFPNPGDCATYYLCDSGLVAHKLDCPSGLLFNPSSKVCDWPQNVKCGN